MLNLPLALIGGVLALVLTGGVISIPAIIGFISLFGMATRGGMLLVDRYNELAQRGLHLTLWQGENAPAVGAAAAALYAL